MPSAPHESPAVLRRRLNRDGYLFFKHFLSPALIRKAHGDASQLCVDLGIGTSASGVGHPEIAERFLLRVGKKENRFKEKDIAFGYRFSRKKSFKAVLWDKRLHRLISSILGGKMVLHPRRIARWARIHYPSERRRPMGIHQDYFYVGWPEETYSVWIPMSHCPVYLGGLAILKGSNHLGVRRHSKRFRVGLPRGRHQQWLTDDYEPGDVLIFPSFTVHGPLPNTTAKILRLAFDFRLCRADSFDAEQLNHPQFGKFK